MFTIPGSDYPGLIFLYIIKVFKKLSLILINMNYNGLGALSLSKKIILVLILQ